MRAKKNRQIISNSASFMYLKFLVQQRNKKKWNKTDEIIIKKRSGKREEYKEEKRRQRQQPWQSNMLWNKYTNTRTHDDTVISLCARFAVFHPFTTWTNKQPSTIIASNGTIKLSNGDDDYCKQHVSCFCSHSIPKNPTIHVTHAHIHSDTHTILMWRVNDFSANVCVYAFRSIVSCSLYTFGTYKCEAGKM